MYSWPYDAILNDMLGPLWARLHLNLDHILRVRRHNCPIYTRPHTWVLRPCAYYWHLAVVLSRLGVH